MHKLVPRLVPKPLWGICLRTELKTKWLKLVSKPIRDAAGNRCEICGGTGDDAPYKSKLHCDEVWRYDTTNGPIASLVDLQSICWWCHGMTHFGRTQSVESNEIKTKVIGKACKVNNITQEIMQLEISKAFKQWKIMSNIKDWTITWDNWKQILEKKVSNAK